MTDADRIEELTRLLAQGRFQTVLDVSGRDEKATSTVYVLRGLAFYFMGMFHLALDSLAAALRLDDDDLEAHINIAYLLACCPEQHVRNVSLALEHAKRACELSGWSAWGPLLVLAAAYANCGMFDEAVAWAKKAKRASPNDQKHRASRVEELARSGQYVDGDLSADFERLIFPAAD